MFYFLGEQNWIFDRIERVVLKGVVREWLINEVFAGGPGVYHLGFFFVALSKSIISISST